MEKYIIEGFLVEQKVGMLSSSSYARRKTGLDFAIAKLNNHYENGLNYVCNYDAVVQLKPGCMRKIIRFVRKKDKEESVEIKYKYAVFTKNDNKVSGFKFIEIPSVWTSVTLGVFDKKHVLDPYLEQGRIAVEDFINKNPQVKPYCDLEVMVKFKPGFFRRIWNFITGNSYKNKFSFDYFSFNIAQDFRTDNSEFKGSFMKSLLNA